MPAAFPFRNRGHEISRLEGFSDVVFGFALTLIVVSLEVPRSYDELLRAMRDFPAFALCFAVLIWIWHAHFTFFRRYALHDDFTVWMNTALLFVVLFYIYPLKFVFASFAGRHGFQPGQARVLFTIYGAGFAGIFGIYAILYRHALKLKDELALTPAEIHDTTTHVLLFAGNVAVGVVSILAAQLLPAGLVGIAGWIYFATGFLSWLIGSRRGNSRRLVEAQMAAQAR